MKYPRGVKFLCTRCALCCQDSPTRARQILLLEREAQQISDFTGQTILSFAEPSQRESPFPYEMKKMDGCCVFLKDKKCMIYNRRPLICRFYPFSLKRDKNIFHFQMSEECPALGEGEKLGRQYFESLLKLALERFEKSRST
jgi:Fe-S-cluster containining protein